MLIGSIPVVFLIAPCVLTGGFLLIGVVSDIWETASNLVTLATLAVQGGAMVGMLIVVQVLIRRHTPFSPYAAPRFPHMSGINSLLSSARASRCRSS